MMVECLDGPCAGESHPVPDDAAVGHVVQRAVPFDSPEPLGSHLQRFATYAYTGDGLKHVPRTDAR